MKSRLPAPIAGQIDQILAGGATGNADAVGGIAKEIGAMFGR